MSALVLSLLLLSPGTVLADWSIEQLAQRSDLIAVGVVGAQRTVMAGELPMTETELRVERVLFGEAGPSLVISQIGGRMGSIIADVPGDARLEPGTRVLVFTYLHRDGRRYLSGMALGAYRVSDSERLEQTIEVPVFDPRSGAVREAPGLRTIRLDEVLRAIRRRK